MRVVSRRHLLAGSAAMLAARAARAQTDPESAPETEAEGEWREVDRRRFMEIREAAPGYGDMEDYRFARAMLGRLRRYQRDPDSRDHIIEQVLRALPRYRPELYRDGPSEMERVLRSAIVHLSPEEE